MISILLLEASDPEAERILVALAALATLEGEPPLSVRRARSGEALVASLAAGPVDVVLAAGAPPGLARAAVLERCAAMRPGVPVVLVQRGVGVDEAVDLGRRGVAALVPADRLERLGEAVRRALAEAERGAEGPRGEAQRRLVAQARLYREAILAGRRKDELLARVAHELRTPLNAMLGWASMLRTRRLDEEARARALEIIERNARAEARIIDGLVDASRMMAGTLRLEVIEVDLCPAVAAAVEAVRPAAEAKGITLSAALDETAGAVAGDPGRLRQVLLEICANALRATPRGGCVGVRLSRVGTEAEIAVSDTGRGICADLLPRVFEGLAPPAGAHGTRGSLGLGLAVARHLVEAHGGAITAESAGEGRGATFTLRLPLLPAAWSERPCAPSPP